jgi:salicylate hydroxylase
MRAPHALIAGAGIGGLCAALCLVRAGWRVSLFEQAKQFEEAGAGLQLTPNASVILSGLNVIKRLTPSSVSHRAIRVRRARDGATLCLMEINDAEERWGAPYLLVHRADLQRALLEAVAREDAIAIHTGVAVASFASGDDGVAVALRQGLIRTEAAGDCLIGADGLRSLVRAKLLGSSPDALRFSKRTAWRSLVASNRVAADLLRPETTLWLGRNAHLVHYPLRNQTVVNVVATIEDKFGDSEDAKGWSTRGDPAFLKARFSAWDGAARALLGSADEWRKWPLFDCDPLDSWTTGRVALLGDAAHPMMPFLAQGAAQAIEDADALGRALGGERDIPRALRTYEAARLPRASRVQRQSRSQAAAYHLGGPAAFARDIALRAVSGERMLARLNWLYDARP